MAFLVAPSPTRLPWRRWGRHLLKAAEFATTPLLPADYGELVAPLHLSSDLQGRLVRRIRETDDAATLVIRPGLAWRGHVAGQYVRLGVDVDGVRHWRAYSLTSATNHPDGLIRITVKKIEGGLVSAHLVDEIRPGTLLHLDQAAGDFVLPDPAPARVLFLTAGSGITPVMGMLRSRPDLTDAVVLHSAPTRKAVVFGGELRDLHAAGRVRLVERHTDEHGLLDLTGPTDLDALVPDWRDRQTWACGPTPMLDAARSLWDAAGLGERLHTERFRPVVLGGGEGGVVTFDRSGTEVDAFGDETILDAGEDAGVLMPSGCRMGICFGCAVPLRSGSVRDLRTGEVTSIDPANDAPVPVQTCISAAAGPCTLDL